MKVLRLTCLVCQKQRQFESAPDSYTPISDLLKQVDDSGWKEKLGSGAPLSGDMDAWCPEHRTVTSAPGARLQ